MLTEMDVEKKSCDQCAWAVVQGQFCHEHGCPNEKKDWFEGYWYMSVQCPRCGDSILEGDECCCTQESEEDDESIEP